MPREPIEDLFETDQFDREVDWGKFPDLELDPDDFDLPEHIADFLTDADELGVPAQFNKASSGAAQRLATGWANVFTNPDGTPLHDLEGDSIDEEEMVKAVNTFMARPQSERAVKDTHRGGPVGTVVESLVMTKALRAAMGLPETFPTGWLATVHVTDDNVWAKVESGEYKSFSIGGTGTRVAMA